MLVRLVRTYLVPYKGELAAILVLQLIGTISALYLPTLNADIIDNGVVKGDIPYIWSTGGVMLTVSLVQVICAISRTSRSSSTTSTQVLRCSSAAVTVRRIGSGGHPVKQSGTHILGRFWAANAHA